MRNALIASRPAAITFTKAATLYIEAHEASWKNEKHRQQWENALTTYAKPKIGSLQVRDVSVPQVLDVLEPIWKTKTETASRLRGRIESVMDWAIQGMAEPGALEGVPRHHAASAAEDREDLPPPRPALREDR